METNVHARDEWVWRQLDELRQRGGLTACTWLLGPRVIRASYNYWNPPVPNIIYIYIYIYIYMHLYYIVHIMFYIALSIYLAIYLSIYLFVCLSIYLSIYLYIYLI
jgi:hypothetical protein